MIVPIELVISLSSMEDAMHPKRKVTRSEELTYRVRDVWRRRDIGFINFSSRFKLHLDIHDSLLYVLSPLKD